MYLSTFEKQSGFLMQYIRINTTIAYDPIKNCESTKAKRSIIDITAKKPMAAMFHFWV